MLSPIYGFSIQRGNVRMSRFLFVALLCVVSLEGFKLINYYYWLSTKSFDDVFHEGLIPNNKNNNNKCIFMAYPYVAMALHPIQLKKKKIIKKIIIINKHKVIKQKLKKR